MKLAVLLVAFALMVPAAQADPHGDDAKRRASHEHGAATTGVPWKRDPFPSTYRPLPRRNTLIVDATVLDGAGHRFEHASLLLSDGKVVALSTQTIAAPADVA